MSEKGGSYSVGIYDIIEEFDLEIVVKPTDLNKILIHVPELNRPGLALKGFYDYFGIDRIQIIGKAEHAYLESLSAQERDLCLERFFKCSFPCVVISRELPVFDELRKLCEQSGVPLLRSKEMTSRFMSQVISYLSFKLAPRITMHGVLVDVYGEGILITGASGVGKSEAALELVRRGHRLVADDAVEVKKMSDKTLIGSAPDMIKHLIEVRGIGIIDVKNLFGTASVKSMDKIDLVINLEMWDESKEYDRLGLDENFTEILGIKLPFLNIPVAPGRNLAIIIEAASINTRQKKFGCNTARELSERLSASLESLNNSEI